jgi:hypothetical protein
LEITPTQVTVNVPITFQAALDAAESTIQAQSGIQARALVATPVCEDTGGTFTSFTSLTEQECIDSVGTCATSGGTPTSATTKAACAGDVFASTGVYTAGSATGANVIVTSAATADSFSVTATSVTMGDAAAFTIGRPVHASTAGTDLIIAGQTASTPAVVEGCEAPDESTTCTLTPVDAEGGGGNCAPGTCTYRVADGNGGDVVIKPGAKSGGDRPLSHSFLFSSHILNLVHSCQHPILYPDDKYDHRAYHIFSVCLFPSS